MPPPPPGRPLGRPWRAPAARRYAPCAARKRTLQQRSEPLGRRHLRLGARRMRRLAGLAIMQPILSGGHLATQRSRAAMANETPRRSVEQLLAIRRSTEARHRLAWHVGISVVVGQLLAGFNVTQCKERCRGIGIHIVGCQSVKESTKRARRVCVGRFEAHRCEAGASCGRKRFAV